MHRCPTTVCSIGVYKELHSDIVIANPCASLYDISTNAVLLAQHGLLMKAIARVPSPLTPIPTQGPNVAFSLDIGQSILAALGINQLLLDISSQKVSWVTLTRADLDHKHCLTKPWLWNDARH